MNQLAAFEKHLSLEQRFRIAKARSRRLLLKFDEAQHPRDENGKWTDGGASDDPTAQPTPPAGMVEAHDLGASASLKYNGKDIKVTKPLRAKNDHLVMFNTAKFDAAFAKDRYGYVGPGGTGNAIGNRYSKVKDYLDKHDAMEASEVHVREDGTASFINGRHRYAAVRDGGATEIPMAVTPEALINAVKNGLLRTNTPTANTPTANTSAGSSNGGSTASADYSSLRTMPTTIEGVSIGKKALKGTMLAVGGSSGITLSTSKRASAAWKDMKAYQEKAFASGWSSSSHPNHVVWHELAHVKVKNGSVDHDSYLTNLQGFNNPHFKSMAEKVSKYAGTNGHEFVAEVFAAVRAGRDLGPEVMNYYKHLKGPTP